MLWSKTMMAWLASDRRGVTVLEFGLISAVLGGVAMNAFITLGGDCGGPCMQVADTLLTIIGR